MPIFDHSYDVVVAGYGFAGGAAAIATADAGGTAIVLEKMLDPGGISITAGGGIRVSRTTEAAFNYIQASNAGRTPDANIWPIAEGMVWLRDWFDGIAKSCAATTCINEREGNYAFPGYDELGFLEVESIPNFDPAVEYPHARALRGGTRVGKGGRAANATGGGAGVFKVVASAVDARHDQIDVRLNAAVKRLIVEDGRIVGVSACVDGKDVNIAARKGVILACGGFESAPDLHQQYWQIAPVLSSACRGNTGDGIRMAQAVGADLWHMWHFHGTYGFRHPQHEDVGIRMKRLPDWRPTSHGVPGDADERAAPMAWVLLDQDGRRFMNEYGPYMQDTGHRDMEPFDPGTMRFPRVPCWCIVDEKGMQMYPLGSPVLNDRDPSVHYDWSSDNQAEVDNGLLQRADSIEELARILSADTTVVRESIEQWNANVAAGHDVLGRPRTSMVALDSPPYYCGQMWPVISNTQGGPRHDPQQCVLNPFDERIPGLYVAGELGSIWGAIYTAGCNLAECFVTAKIAAEHAMSEAHES